MPLQDELMLEAKVKAAIFALGESEEDFHFAAKAKQVWADGRRYRVNVALSHLAFYSFDCDPGSSNMRCRERLPYQLISKLWKGFGGREVGLECGDNSQNVVIRFTSKSDSGIEDAEVLLSELQALIFDISGADLQIEEKASDLRKLVHPDTKTAGKRLADRTEQITRHGRMPTESPVRNEEPQVEQSQQVNNHLPAISEDDGQIPSSNGNLAREELFRESSQESIGTRRAKASLSEVFQGSDKRLRKTKSATKLKGSTDQRDNFKKVEAKLAGVDKVERFLRDVDGAAKTDNTGGIPPSFFARDDFMAESLVDQCINLGLEGELPSGLSAPELQRQREESGKELQKRVHQNYPQFIEAAQAVAAMEDDIRTLRSQISETTTLLSQLEELPYDVDVATNSIEDSGRQRIVREISWQERLGSFISEEPDPEFQDMLDALDARLVEHKYPEAVACLEDLEKFHKSEVEMDHAVRKYGRKSLSTQIKHVLEPRINTIVQGIWQQVQSPSVQIMQVNQAVNLLLRLGRSSNAHALFFYSRTSFLNSEVSRLVPRDIQEYIADLCKITFACIHQTVEEFQHVFEKQRQTSALLTWTVETLSLFGAIFCQEVFASDDLAVIGNCVKNAQTYCSELRKIGLVMDHQLNNSLLQPLAQKIQTSIIRIREAVLDEAKDEGWQSKQYTMQELEQSPQEEHYADTQARDRGNNLASGRPTGVSLHSFGSETDTRFSLTRSAKVSYQLLFQLARSMENSSIGTLLAGELGLRVESQVEELIAQYVNHMPESGRRVSQGSSEARALLSNADNLLAGLLPALLAVLRGNRVKQSSDETAGSSILQEERDRMWEAFCSSRHSDLAAELRWLSLDYSKGSVDANPRPSERLQKMLAQTGALGELINRHLSEKASQRLLREVLTRVVEQDISSAKFWERYTPKGMPCGFGKGGIQQFVLDTRFLKAGCGGVAPSSSYTLQKMLHQAESRALKEYCDAMDEDPEEFLHNETWHEEVIRRTLLAMSGMTAGLFLDSDRDLVMDSRESSGSFRS